MVTSDRRPPWLATAPSPLQRPPPLRRSPPGAGSCPWRYGAARRSAGGGPSPTPDRPRPRPHPAPPPPPQAPPPTGPLEWKESGAWEERPLLFRERPFPVNRSPSALREVEA